MKTYTITSAILKFKGKYLIAKRAKTKKFGANKWEFISGFVEDHKSAEETILKELDEELKLKGKIKRTANVFEIKDKEARWIIIPFLIELENDKFVINKKDHSEVKFVDKKELYKYSELKKDIELFRDRKLI